MLDGLGDERERGEVQDAVEAPASASRVRVRVEQVDLDEAGAVRDGRAVPAREVVEHGDLVARARAAACATTEPM